MAAKDKAGRFIGPGPGRPKGVPNKINGLIRDMIVEALHNKGGVKYLEKQAEENPVAFMGLVGKVLPMQVVGAGDGPVETITRIEIVAGGSRNG